MCMCVRLCNVCLRVCICLCLCARALGGYPLPACASSSRRWCPRRKPRSGTGQARRPRRRRPSRARGTPPQLKPATRRRVRGLPTRGRGRGRGLGLERERARSALPAAACWMIAQGWYWTNRGGGGSRALRTTPRWVSVEVEGGGVKGGWSGTEWGSMVWGVGWKRTVACAVRVSWWRVGLP
jgi:hypothetical protein